MSLIRVLELLCSIHWLLAFVTSCSDLPYGPTHHSETDTPAPELILLKQSSRNETKLVCISNNTDSAITFSTGNVGYSEPLLKPTSNTKRVKLTLKNWETYSSLDTSVGRHLMLDYRWEHLKPNKTEIIQEDKIILREENTTANTQQNEYKFCPTGKEESSKEEDGWKYKSVLYIPRRNWLLWFSNKTITQRRDSEFVLWSVKNNGGRAVEWRLQNYTFQGSSTSGRVGKTQPFHSSRKVCVKFLYSIPMQPAGSKLVVKLLKELRNETVVQTQTLCNEESIEPIMEEGKTGDWKKTEILFDTKGYAGYFVLSFTAVFHGILRKVYPQDVFGVDDIQLCDPSDGDLRNLSVTMESNEQPSCQLLKFPHIKLKPDYKCIDVTGGCEEKCKELLAYDQLMCGYSDMWLMTNCTYQRCRCYRDCLGNSSVKCYLNLMVFVKSNSRLIIDWEPRCLSYSSQSIKYKVSYHQHTGSGQCKMRNKSLGKLKQPTVTSNTVLTVRNLHPCSVYCVELSSTYGDECSTIVSTEQGVPNPVQDFTVYSKGNDWVSLRWKQPSNICANSYTYFIRMSTHTSINNSIVFSTPCSLMDNWICATVSNLQYNTTYVVLVSVNNGVLESSPVSTFATTVEEGPTQPLGLVVTNITSDEAVLTWKHPDKTNGKLLRFHIKVVETSTWLCEGDVKNSSLNFIVKNESPEYSLKVKELQSLTQYQVTVVGVTVVEGQAATVKFQTSFAQSVSGEHTHVVADSKNKTTMTLYLPPAQPHFTDISAYIVLVGCRSCQDVTEDGGSFLNDTSLPEDLVTCADMEQIKFKWIAGIVEPEDQEVPFIVGSNVPASGDLRGMNIINRPLDAQEQYKIMALVERINGTDTKCCALQLQDQQTQQTTQDDQLFIILTVCIILLVVVCLVSCVCRFRGKLCNRVAGRMRLTPSVLYDDIGMALSSEQRLLRPLSHRVAVSELENYVRMALHSRELRRQHAEFRRGEIHPWNYGCLPENHLKNRYKDFIAYDATRVILNKLPGDDYSDYINANYIDGYNAEKFYIAAQGPKPNTVDDFWRMVWQEHVQVIVMMTNVVENGQTKCEKYWPGLGKEMICGRISIFTSSEEIFADYTLRTLNIMFMGNTKKVSHMQFTSWPSNGVPLYFNSMVMFLAKLQEVPREATPILVHCSAGFGRTGAIILADICLRMAEAEGAVDVLRYLQAMREQRANMVDSKEQYILVHIVLVESLLRERTCYPWNRRFPECITYLQETGGLAKQFRELQKVQPWDIAMKSRTSNIQAVMQMIQHRPSHKDRFSDIIPGPTGAVKIVRFPMRDATSDYINAVYVDGFRIKDLFIVTQLPMVNTVGDFWRMVYEKNISLIVMLNEMDLSDEDLDANHRFFPSINRPTSPVPYLKLSLVQQTDMTQWSLSKYHVENIKSYKLQKIRVIRVKGWNDDCDTPENPGMLVELWREVETHYSGKGSVIITCLDGARACGLFVAAAFLIEKIKLEQQCDVCQAVRVVRQNRKQFIRSQEQFEFLYRVAVEFLTTFQHYANFDSE